MDWKKILRKLLFPPVWLMAVLTVLSAAGLVYVFTGGLESSPIAYGVYVLAFYTLCVVCLFCATVLPKQYHTIREKMLSVPLIHRYKTDRIFKTKTTLLFSFCANLFYAGLNAISWVLYDSWWFFCLMIYYVILAVMRYLLVRYVRLNEIGVNRTGELRRARVCSWILLLINLFLSGAVLMILYQNKGYEYSGMLIYIMAMYTFYITTNAIINLFKYRKFGSPVMETAKIISMAAALVSMLNLETAMFAQFGADMALADRQLMIILTGAGVSILVVTMSLLMIVSCTRELRKLPRNRHTR